MYRVYLKCKLMILVTRPVMYEYVAKSQFQTPNRLVCKGDALRISSLKAAGGVRDGVLIEKNVSGLLDIPGTSDSRTRLLVEKLNISPESASQRAKNLIDSLTKRNESLQTYSPPTTAFLEEVAEFNRITKGYDSPISKINSKTGAGEWAGYNCNIGSGCSFGCLGCYAENMADRFNRIDIHEEWLQEKLRDVSTANCKKYPGWIMAPTSHDLSEFYLPAFRCHLYNILLAGNGVLVVTKPRRSSIMAICSEFSSFRDQIIFRFTIGSLDNEALRVMNPFAPSLNERLWCLKYAFEQGFRTSISCEPMLMTCEEAERFYYTVEPLVTENIWFGKMSGIGGLKKHLDPEVVRRATELMEVYKNRNILKFVETMKDLPKVEWKDSIKKVINKYARISS